MEKNGLNKNTLSKACDIPYTTIDGWYKKGYEGLRLVTLRKLANYFDTTLDFWAEDKKKPATVSSDGLTPQSQEFMKCFEQLDSDTQQKLLELAHLYVDAQRKRLEKE